MKWRMSALSGHVDRALKSLLSGQSGRNLSESGHQKNVR
jgi:hypothetical protein